MTRSLGYFFPIEIRHIDEITMLENKKEAHKASQSRGGPKLPPYERRSGTNWCFVRSGFNCRFRGIEIIVEVFTYTRRKCRFQYLEKLFEVAIGELKAAKDDFPKEIYKDKLDLLDEVKLLIHYYKDDIDLYRVLHKKGPPAMTPFEDYAKKMTKEMLITSLRDAPHCRVPSPTDPESPEMTTDEMATDDTDDGSEDVDEGLVDRVIEIWFNGFADKYIDSTKNHVDEKYVDDAFFMVRLKKLMMKELDKDKNYSKAELEEMVNRSPERGEMLSQKQMATILLKLLEFISKRWSSPNCRWSNSYMKVVYRFIQIGHDALASTKTTFSLERNGFKLNFT